MDTFFDNSVQIEVLKEQYKKFGKLTVAVDFDDTLSSYRGKDCSMVQQLVRDLKPYATILIFTARDTDKKEVYDMIKDFLVKNNIPYDYINREYDGSKITGRKIMFNQLLDDKASLFGSYSILKTFLLWVKGL